MQVMLRSNYGRKMGFHTEFGDQVLTMNFAESILAAIPVLVHAGACHGMFAMLLVQHKSCASQRVPQDCALNYINYLKQ